MRKYAYPLIAVLFLFGVLSCGSEESGDLQYINYDGPNFSSPQLPQGSHEMGVYFPSGEWSDHTGRTIKNIRFYVYALPEEFRIKISDGTSSTQPGTVLYNQNFVGFVRENAWNIHTLANPFEIAGDPLWVSIEFTNTDTQQTVGCDSGPANSNGGDWLNQSTDNQWRTFRDRTGESVNWNIRVELND